MKNLFKMLLVALLACAAVACNEVPDEVNPGNDTPQLETPIVAHQVDANNVVLTWSEVEDALYYTVRVDEEEPVRVEETTYVVRALSWNTTHKIYITAVSHDEQYLLSSEPAVVEVTLGGRIAPAYREWYAQNGAAATAISNNGRYVVGAYDKQGFVLDLELDQMDPIMNAEFYDVSDSGIAVGSNHAANLDGVAAYYKDGEVVDVSFDEFLSSADNCGGAALVAIMPDASFAVGWLWDYGDTDYTLTYGMMIPVKYDFATDEVSVLPAGDFKYVGEHRVGLVPKCIASDGVILGYDYSYDMFSGVWNSAEEEFEYLLLEVDDRGLPLKTIGDSNNRMSQDGRYVYGIAKNYSNNIAKEVAAAYDREAGEIIYVGGATVTAMTDAGIAFINDAPYYMGETSYIVDVTSGDLETLTPIADWLLEEYDMNLVEEIPYGIIVNAVSADGNTIVGIANTDQGWVTSVICLDGVIEE